MMLHPKSLFRSAFAQGCGVLCADACNALNYCVLGGGIAVANRQINNQLQSLPEVPTGIFGRLCCVYNYLLTLYY